MLQKVVLHSTSARNYRCSTNII